MRLSTSVRESNPLILLPGGVPDIKEEVINFLIDTIRSTLPRDTPKAFELPHSLFLYLGK